MAILRRQWRKVLSVAHIADHQSEQRTHSDIYKIANGQILHEYICLAFQLLIIDVYLANDGDSRMFGSWLRLRLSREVLKLIKVSAMNLYTKTTRGIYPSSTKTLFPVMWMILKVYKKKKFLVKKTILMMYVYKLMFTAAVSTGKWLSAFNYVC